LIQSSPKMVNVDKFIAVYHCSESLLRFQVKYESEESREEEEKKEDGGGKVVEGNEVEIGEIFDREVVNYFDGVVMSERSEEVLFVISDRFRAMPKEE
jgi:hypothetical protein